MQFFGSIILVRSRLHKLFHEHHRTRGNIYSCYLRINHLEKAKKQNKSKLKCSHLCWNSSFEVFDAQLVRSSQIFFIITPFCYSCTQISDPTLTDESGMLWISFDPQQSDHRDFTETLTLSAATAPSQKVFVTIEACSNPKPTFLWVCNVSETFLIHSDHRFSTEELVVSSSLSLVKSRQTFAHDLNT